MKLISIFVLLSLLGLVIMAPIEDQENGVVDSNPPFHQSETEPLVEKRHNKNNHSTRSGRKNNRGHKHKHKQSSSSEEGK